MRAEDTRVIKGKELQHVSVLGNLAVLRHGTRLQLPRSKKTRALLAYLAVTARSHRRDRLCDMFWKIPDDPRAALRWSLSRLRPLVDEPDQPRIVGDRESVGLELRGVEVDILSLRSACRNGIDSLSTAVLCQATEALEGDFLEGLDLPDCLEFQSWCTAEREETRRLRGRLLTELVTRLEAVPDQALRHARALNLLEPADEVAQATLIRLLRAAGRWREAEEHLQMAELRLQELNVACTGALQRAAQCPQADARSHADGSMINHQQSGSRLAPREMRTSNETQQRTAWLVPLPLVNADTNRNATIARNKALVRRFYEEIDKGNLDAMDELVAEDYVDHSPPAFPGLGSGREGFKNSFKLFLEATPGYHKIEDQIAEGDKVVTRLRAYGTHAGDLPGIPRTGNKLTVTAIVIHRIANGKLVEKWSNKDALGYLQQLGLMPGP
jgi:DNA-binding SARP family transcriptional activator/predicted ester cyclase